MKKLILRVPNEYFRPSHKPIMERIHEQLSKWEKGIIKSLVLSKDIEVIVIDDGDENTDGIVQAQVVPQIELLEE